MNIRSLIKNLTRNILSRFGFEIVPKAAVFDWQVKPEVIKKGQAFLPPGAREYLTSGNPRLKSYQQRYADANVPASAALLWTDSHINELDMLYFRGHNAFIFQEGKFNRHIIGYVLAYYYLKSIDKRGLLDVFEEDNAFGAVSFKIDGKNISRDLLDSLLEIYFLERHLEIFQKSGLRVLDIGAGYGRLAHRMSEALPNLDLYICADAVPLSSFMAEYYLDFRKINNRARVIPLNSIWVDLQPATIDLAVNIHSFSECTLPAISWWLDLLKHLQVPDLMIIPNSGKGLLTVDGKDFDHLVTERGYELIVREPKYLDPILQKYALNPDYFYLYHLR
jgi:SAM-dependent methyltransferase